MILYEYDYHLDTDKDITQLNEDDIARLYVDSSNIRSFWFKETNKHMGMGVLTVEFLNGAIYEYYRVPDYVAELFTRAPSFGRFLWRNIRGIYPYQRVDADKAVSRYKQYFSKPKKSKKKSDS